MVKDAEHDARLDGEWENPYGVQRGPAKPVEAKPEPVQVEPVKTQPAKRGRKPKVPK